MKNQLLTNKMKRNMKRVKLFLMLMLLTVMSTNAWSAVVSGTAYSFNKNYTPAGWTYSHRTGESKAEYLVICKPDYICSEAFFQQSITSIVINMRRYGGTDAQATVTLTWVDSSTGTETALGTLAPASGTTLANATLSSFTNTPTANTTGYIKFTCPSANNTDKGAGIASIKINYTACSKKFNVYISSIDHGSASSDKSTACPGEIVTITLSPDANYGLDAANSYAQYYDENDDYQQKYFSNSFFTKVNSNTYTFIMPDIYEDGWLEEIAFYIYMSALPNRSVTWHVPSGCVTSPADGTSTTAKVFPNPTPLVSGYKFEGWVASAIPGTQSSRPATVYAAGEPIPSNGTYYALYSSISTTFTKVTDAIPVDGKNYLLCNAYSATARAWKNEVDANKRLTSKEWDCSSATTTCNDWDCIWTFIRGTGSYSDYWFIYNAQVGKYLGANSTTTSKTTSPVNYEVKLIDGMSDASAWQFSQSSGRLTLTNKLRTANGTAAQQKIYCSGNYAGFGYSTSTSPYFFVQGEVAASYTTSPDGCAATYTVTYEGGSGATGSVTDTNSPYDPGYTPITVKSNGFTKTDYNFTGWVANVDIVNASTSATITQGTLIAPSTTFTMPSSNVVFTAQWEAKEYLYGSSCEPLENITVTYNDAGSTTNVEYGVGTQVTVDSRTGTHGCAEWTFVGWQRGSAVADNSTSYTPVHNFTATAGDDDAVFYAVYEKVNTDWISAFDGSELKSGATYVIVKAQADNNHRALSTTVASTNYLTGTQLATDCETVQDAYDNNRYKLTVTPTADLKWEASYVNSSWRLYNKALGKYIKLSSSDASVALTTACEDAFTITPATHGIYDNDSELHIQSGSNSKYLGWYNSGPYWHGNASSRSLYMCTNSNSFTSTPDCGLRTVTFHGNGGTVIASGGSPTGANLGITETVRDEPITTPTATFADCNGKSWSFVGWSDHEIDVTRVPVLTTDLLNDGGGNKSHTVTASDEEYWAVFSNTGAAETKYGTINIVPADIHGDYRDELTFTKTVTSMGDYTFAYYHVGDQSSLGIQFDYANATKGYLKNTTSLGKINSISFSTFGTGSISDVQVYVGNSADACNTLLTAAELQTVSGVSTYYPKNNYAYVKIQASGYVGIGTISIDFGKGTQVWATTPDCSTITLEGTPRITSYANKTVKGVTALTVNAKQLKASTALSFAAYNVADDTPNSHFGFVGSVSADGSGEVEDETIIVTYTPDAGATTDGIEEVYFKATALADDNVTTTESNKQSGYGRHLPTKFVIATKVSDKWYGMPNNITSSSFGTRALIPIVVDDATSPTTATVYTSTTDYLAWNLDVAGTGTARYTNKGDHLFFSSPINSNRDLAGDATGLRNSAVASTSSGYEAFAWSPTTTDLGNYTLKNGNATTYYIATDGSANWTTSTTGANVRFLIIDEQPAPDITWYNDMLDADHATNKAENGVVTLPTGADPVSCNATLLPTFCGWKDGAIATYVTSAPTYVQAGDAATTDKRYYAVFKHATLDRWYTDCPTIYTITYTANGGTGSDHLEYTMTTTADAITVGEAGFSKEGCTFVGWTNPDDVDGKIITPGSGKITGLSGDITLNAVWIGTTTITGTVRLTTAAGEKVATSGTEVTISSTDFACATALRITYKDVTNDVTYGRSGTPSYTSSEFRLCDGSYGSADGGNISLAEVSGAYNQTFSITYEPNGGANTLDEYQLKVEVLLKNTVIDTKTLSLYGRTLPASFAIAIKVGGSWYALPNNMDSEGTYDPILISVTEDASVLNWTAQGPSTVAYKMKDYTPNYSKLRFAANDANENCLWAATGNSASIRNWSPTSTASNYAWTVTPDANFNVYTMANLANTRTALKINDSKWEMYNTGGLSEIHFIPLTTVTPIDVTVMEWGADEIAVKTVANWTPSAITAQISGGSPSAVTKTSIGGDLYKLTGVGDLQGNPGEPLALNVTDGGAKQAIIQIPFIVTDTKTEAQLATILKDAGYAATLPDARNLTKNMDVIVRRNGTLSSSSSTSGTFQNVYIYPGGKADFSKDISIQNIYMRGGFSWLGGAYAHPQMNVASTASISGIGSTGHGIFYDLYLDNSIYYVFALPKDVAVTAITNEENGDDWDAWIKSYSGEGRTLSPKVSGWHYVTSGSIARGAGYEIAIKPRLNRPYGILRFPLLKSTAWSAETDCTPSVKGWGANNANVSDNNKGWNFIGNPFLTAYNNSTTPGSTPSGLIQTQTLVPSSVVPWDGKYVWSSSNVKYFTIPRYTEYEYDDVRAYPYKLDAFFPFFIQATGDGTLSFDDANRALKAPTRYVEETQREVIVDFILQNASGKQDLAGLTICDNYSADFDMNDKEKTIQNGNSVMKVYTMVGEYRTAFNSLPEAAAAQPIPVGYIAPAAGNYSFSLQEGDFSQVEHVWLTDYTESSTVDLLNGIPYQFETAAGTFNERFALNVILRSQQETPTGTGQMEAESDQPQKFIYQEKMYIMRGGVIYDATGKRVREINR